MDLPPSLVTYNIRSLLHLATGPDRTRKFRTANAVKSVALLHDFTLLQETNLGNTEHYLPSLVPEGKVFHNNLSNGVAGTAVIVSRRLKALFSFHSKIISKGHAQALHCTPVGTNAFPYPLVVINVYFPQLLADQLKLIRLLDRFVQSVRSAKRNNIEPIIYMAGDFNFVLSAADGGGSTDYYTPSQTLLSAWYSLVGTAGLREVHQPLFTFYRKRGTAFDMSRLDRAYISCCEGLADSWQASAALVDTPFLPHTDLGRTVSDHAPLAIRWHLTRRRQTTPLPSGFHQQCSRRIIASPEFRMAFQELWDKPDAYQLDHDSPRDKLMAFVNTIRKATQLAAGRIPERITTPLHQLQILRQLLTAMREQDHDRVDELADCLGPTGTQIYYDFERMGYNEEKVVQLLNAFFADHSDTVFDYNDELPLPYRSRKLKLPSITMGAAPGGLGATSLPSLSDIGLPRPLTRNAKLLQQLGTVLPSSRRTLTELIDPAHPTCSRTADPKRMASILGDYWSRRWTSQGCNRKVAKRFLSQFAPGPTPMGPITVELVEDVIRNSKSSSAGPDGIPFLAYRRLVDYASPIIADYIDALGHETAPPLPHFNLCALIPLEKQASGRVEDTRPISIPSALNRLISAVLCRLLTEAVGPRLHRGQQAGVPGRVISDNIFSVNEWLHSRVSSKTQGYVMLIDFAKAFDSLEHEYIFEALDAWGVPAYHKQIYKALLHEVQVCPVVCGQALSPHISVERGIKQGDPCSPLVFCMVLDPLLQLIELISNGTPYGFMDDVAITLGCLSDLPRLMKLFEGFASASGLVVHLTKTHIIPALAEQADYATAAACGLTIRAQAKYLGVLIGPSVGPGPVFAAAVDKLSQRIRNYLPLKKHFKLQRRVIIANVFLLSILGYWLQFYILPRYYHNLLEGLLRAWLVPLGTSAFLPSDLERPTSFIGLKTPLLSLRFHNWALLSKSTSKLGPYRLKRSAASPRMLRHIRLALYELANKQVAPSESSATVRKRLLLSTPMQLQYSRRIVHRAPIPTSSDGLFEAGLTNHLGPNSTIFQTFFLFWHNALATRVRVKKCLPKSLRAGYITTCSFCGQAPEDREHIFRYCSPVRRAKQLITGRDFLAMHNFSLSWSELYGADTPCSTTILRQRHVVRLAFITATWLALLNERSFHDYQALRSTRRILAHFNDILNDCPSWHQTAYGHPPRGRQLPPLLPPVDYDKSDSDDAIPPTPGPTWAWKKLVKRRLHRRFRSQLRLSKRKRPLSHYEVQILWADNSLTWEPVSCIDPCPQLTTLFPNHFSN